MARTISTTPTTSTAAEMLKKASWVFLAFLILLESLAVQEASRAMDVQSSTITSITERNERLIEEIKRMRRHSCGAFT